LLQGRAGIGRTALNYLASGGKCMNSTVTRLVAFALYSNRAELLSAPHNFSPRAASQRSQPAWRTPELHVPSSATPRLLRNKISACWKRRTSDTRLYSRASRQGPLALFLFPLDWARPVDCSAVIRHAHISALYSNQRSPRRALPARRPPASPSPFSATPRLRGDEARA
jgi:hypothetical protein